MGERNYWMIGADGKSYGPADHETMLRWIQERRITASTQVGEHSEGPWNDAGSQPEFASALGVGSGAPPTPDAPRTPDAPPMRPMPSVPGQPADWPPSNLQTVLLIGGIFNVLVGGGTVLWALLAGIASFGLGCLCGLPGLIPLIVGILQIVDYNGAARTEPRRYLDRTQMWGVINIVLIIMSCLPALVCGILQLVWLGDARRKYLNS